MKLPILLFLCLLSFTGNAQTSRELIGKWKLVKQTQNGTVKTPENTYQVFLDGGEFKGINGDDSRKGKWTLSANNKELTIKMGIISVTFTVDLFDPKKRIISSEKTGTLEYEKVGD